jgi:hypothetical protein
VSTNRTLWADLRKIDQAVVPRVATAWRRVRRSGQALRVPRLNRVEVATDRTDRIDDRTGRSARAGAAATLARLDQRFASRGVLALVRDVPQVGIVGLAIVLVVASVVTAVRLSRPSEDNSSPDLPTVGGAHIATVGPLPGEAISSYLTAAQAALTQQAAESPRQLTYALVDFESGRTPSQVADALPGVAPQLLYVRVRVSGDTKTFPSTAEELSAYGALKTPVRVTRLPGDAVTAFVRLAGALDQAAGDNTTFAGTIGNSASPEELVQRDATLKDARHYRAEATALRSGCACIYAVVIYGTAETLLHILDSGRVRAIDPASPGLKLSEITWVPLRPEVTRTQPAGAGSGA